MKFVDDSLLGFLKGKDSTYFIPPYQRNYEWTEEQCLVLWEDVCNASQKPQEQNIGHFFGSITYVSRKIPSNNQYDFLDQWELIDGQQRITSTMLLLAALRDVAEGELGASINERYLKNDKQTGDGKFKIKLKQTESDSDVYQKIILKDRTLLEDERSSQLYKNYVFFLKKVREFKAKDTVLDLLLLGLSRFHVLLIELQPLACPWENPQKIFESLNTLGKPLSFADLVRNYLLLGLEPDSQVETYSVYWLKIEKALQGEISNFIRDYLQIKIKTDPVSKEATEKQTFLKKASETNSKELYRKFKQYFEATFKNRPRKEAIVNVMKELAEFSDLYAFILGKHAFDKGNAKIVVALRDICDELKVTTARSFILALFKEWKDGNFSNDDLQSLLEALRSYLLRRRILKLTQAENKLFVSLIGHVDQLKAAKDKKSELFKILSKQYNALRIPNDFEVEQRLGEMNFYNSDYSMFFLRLIEEALTKNRPEYSPPNEILTQEHIFPQTPSKAWLEKYGKDGAEKHAQYVHLLGNITLTRHNSELGNRPFAEKKRFYNENSGLEIARRFIIDQDEWTFDSIARRNKEMIRILLAYPLAIPDEYRRTNNFSEKIVKHKEKSFRFGERGLVGKTISFIKDPTLKAKVLDDKNVEFKGEKFKLAPLTRKIYEGMGIANKSGAYQGCLHWEYDGVKLSEIPRNAIRLVDNNSPNLTQSLVVKRGLAGKTIRFIQAVEYEARIIDDKHVEFEGRRKRLTALTKELFKRIGKEFTSRKPYRYWECDGVNLALLMLDNGAASSDGE